MCLLNATLPVRGTGEPWPCEARVLTVNSIPVVQLLQITHWFAADLPFDGRAGPDVLPLVAKFPFPKQYLMDRKDEAAALAPAVSGEIPCCHIQFLPRMVSFVPSAAPKARSASKRHSG